MGNGDSVIVAIIMIGMIVAGIIGVIIAVKKGNSGFISSVKYKENNEEDDNEKSRS